MTHILYLVIIQPIISFLEFIFSYFYINCNTGILLTIIVMSFVVSSLCLPFYLRAEEISEEELEIQKKMSEKIKTIKKNFKGDERMFLIQTCYRQNNYHPIMGLRLSLSLLLQIPIFMAAYIFFTHINILDNKSIWLISNIMQPDNLLNIGIFKINILPFIMTIINLTAGYVYTKDLSFSKNKLQIIISTVFLVLLYNSPAILVLYWTFNNLFSLFKNICLRFLSVDNLFRILLFTAAVFYCLFVPLHYMPHNIFNIILPVLFILKCIKLPSFKTDNPADFTTKLFCLSMAGLWLITGVLIPSNVIASSPQEFMFNTEYNPFRIILYTMSIYFGVFLFWGFCIFYVSKYQGRIILGITSCIACFWALFNLHFCKLPNYPLLNNLNFNVLNVNFEAVNFRIFIYLPALILIACLFVCLIKKSNSSKFINGIFTILITSLLFLTGNNFVKIHKTVNIPSEEQSASIKCINLSQTHKNILIIFLDRAINSYFELIIAERPELKEQYRGFTYYPNTLSFARYTALGYLPILGGYEYTPQNIDKTSGNFITKYNQALTVLPAIFASQNNWTATVIQPESLNWANIINNKELRTLQKENLYKQNNIKTYFFPNLAKKTEIDTEKRIFLAKRNMLYFSIMSILPPNGQKFIYDAGNYHSIENIKFYSDSNQLIQSYYELENMPEFTKFDAENNTFHVFNNELPHNPELLSAPDYKPDLSGKKPEIQTSIFSDDFTSLAHYHVNAASIILIGKYMDFLRKNGVYDNTRIIIVADHGSHGLDNPNFTPFEKEYILPFNPLLLVKDFDSNKPLTKDITLMTNADVPLLATNQVIKNPRNPYTGNILTSDDKHNGIYIKNDNKWNIDEYLNLKKIINENDRFNYVNGNIREPKNWRINAPLLK